MILQLLLQTPITITITFITSTITIIMIIRATNGQANPS